MLFLFAYFIYNTKLLNLFTANPLLIYKKGVSNVKVGTRKTMSDNGATCCDYFNVEKCENGTSYLDLIK